MSYHKIKAIIRISKDVNSPQELLKSLGEDPAFFYGKKKKVLIRRQRKQYIDKCVNLGLLNENYQLTELGIKALENFDEILSQIIFDIEVNGRKFKEILLEVLAVIDIPTVERISEKMYELDFDLPIQQLRDNLNILAKCGILQKNRKYTYTLKKIDVNDFEAILKQEFENAEKDPTGTIWFEQYKETIQKKYNLAPSQFDELFAELKRKKPRLISLQRSRTKSWLLLREI